MKKILIILVMSGIALSYLTPKKVSAININKISNISCVPPKLIIKDNKLFSYTMENKIKEMLLDLSGISHITDRMDWFINYKEIISNYDGILDLPETVYDYFSEEEVKLICKAVETECFEQDFESKVNVANVIFNRIEEGGEYGSTVNEVITKPNQFAYGRQNISEDTILAVEYAFSIEDTTNGCIGFHSNEKSSTFNGWEYSFTDDAMHHFYKEREDSNYEK